jgi:UDP-N-acetylglucosamine 2-epimerase (non-hydrolysing)
LDQVLEFFEITPDNDLALMKANQTLFDVTADGLKGLEKILNKSNPDLIFVQGDTTTAFIGALAGFYKKIPVAHLEAGLRSGNKMSPYPEECNRIMAGHLADYQFAPTPRAVNNLKLEGITNNVHMVGNTVIDALFLGLELIKSKGEDPYLKHFNFLDFTKKTILVTGHRRESFGEPFENLCKAIRDIAINNPDVEIVYPVHLNPNVRKTVNKYLSDINRVHLIEPLSYPYLIWLMEKSYLVLTDSGGIQEEAPSLGKPVLVMRDVTERQEGVEAGTAKLVGTNYDVIMTEASRLLDDKSYYESMSKAVNPYGDGTTSKQIAEILKN